MPMPGAGSSRPSPPSLRARRGVRERKARRKGPMNEPQAVETTRIDETIERIEGLYRAITGKDAPQADAAYAPIPAEKDPARHVEERLDHLLALLSGDGAPRAAAEPSWSPPVSVWEAESELVVCVDLPQISREEVSVTIQGNVLTVSGR